MKSGMRGGPMFSPRTGKIVGFLECEEVDGSSIGFRIPVDLRGLLASSYASRGISQRLKDG